MGDRTTVPGSIFWHNVDGKEYVRELRVENDPLLKTPSIIADEEESEKRDEGFDGRFQPRRDAAVVSNLIVQM